MQDVSPIMLRPIDTNVYECGLTGDLLYIFKLSRPTQPFIEGNNM